MFSSRLCMRYGGIYEYSSGGRSTPPFGTTRKEGRTSRGVTQKEGHRSVFYYSPPTFCEELAFFILSRGEGSQLTACHSRTASPFSCLFLEKKKQLVWSSLRRIEPTCIDPRAFTTSRYKSSRRGKELHWCWCTRVTVGKAYSSIIGKCVRLFFFEHDRSYFEHYAELLQNVTYCCTLYKRPTRALGNRAVAVASAVPSVQCHPDAAKLFVKWYTPVNRSRINSQDLRAGT